MSWFYRRFLRPALFAQDAEQIHHSTLRGLAWASRHELVCDALASFFGAPELSVDVFGLRFPNPVGLAAGLDKHAEALPVWPALGFGFSELGAVTWHAQPGNPRPRLFRVVPHAALINRMGFNNPGAQAVAQALADWRLCGRWPNHPVGMNLGKSKVTPLEQAPQDYAASFRLLLPHLDFFVINVSSPNTPDLRRLQDKAALDEILAAIQEAQPPETQFQGAKRDERSLDPSPASPIADPRSRITHLSRRSQTQADHALRLHKPILVKIAPDLSFEALDEILELAASRRIAGIVATNTTTVRPPTEDPQLQRIYAESGGLSGRPLRARSTEIIRHLYRQSRGALPIIGVGGIFSAADAWEKITAGASLVQVYSGMVFEGPGLPKAIVAGLIERLDQAGLTDLRRAVGTAL